MRSKHIHLFIFLVSFCGSLWAQETDEILFEIDDNPVYSSEFLRMYNKQIEMLGTDDQDSKKAYFELFLNYKIKVKEATDLKLDTFSSFRNELNTHRERLMEPYLKDEKASEFLISEAYTRSITEVRASHILIKLPSSPSVQDTVEAYDKISTVRGKILSGANFEIIAQEYSEDPSVSANKGDLGYFSAFDMVYPFECAAYETKVGEISEPFRTKFGYHIVHTTALRKSRGNREVAHIMLSLDSENGKKRIDSIYKVLQKNPDAFENLAREFSEDRASSENGGKLPKIGIGDTIESFEKAAFGIEKEETFTEPIETEFGWHIIKLLKIYPVPTEEELYAKLKKKVLSDSRSVLETKGVINRLESEFQIIENISPISSVFNKNLAVSESEKKVTVLSINDENYSLEDFIVFLKKEENKTDVDAFKKFKEVTILEYYKRHLEASNEEFKETLSEFREGMLLFNLMEQEVWKRSKDVNEQRSFYEANLVDYDGEFSVVQGKVISDYQLYLENQWMTRLKKEHTVKINSEVLSKLLNE